MSRAVTEDHILFDECISAFRPRDDEYFYHIDEQSYSYLLTSFILPTHWNLPYCTVQPSIRADLAGAKAAFICKIKNPRWCGTHNSHLFGIALSSIVTFVTGHACKSTRDYSLCQRKELSKHDISELSLINPVLIAGPGAVTSNISIKKIKKYEMEISKIISKLQAVPYPTYIIIMQAIRLVHLSLSTKKDDFGLAYLLIVSAIEAISQHAIPRKKVAKKHPKETEWSAKSKEDAEFAELFSTYKDARGQNSYLKDRYIQFINSFAPSDTWENIVPHQLESFADLREDPSGDLLDKYWFEIYPSELNSNKLLEIISDSYTHRSCFIHRGEQPPHKYPTSANRFFQEYREIREGRMIEKLLPNYNLLLGIAQHSISGWLETIKSS